MKQPRYSSDAPAQRPTPNDGRSVGIIVSNIENPFFLEVIKSFQTRAQELGCGVLLNDTNYNPRHAEEAAERMIEYEVRGLAIMTSEISSSLVNRLARRKIAATFLDLGPVRDCVSNMRIEYESGIDQIVRYLHETGHTSIAFVAGRTGLKSNDLRREAYENTMHELGLIPGPIFPGNLHFDGGIEAGLAIAKLSRRPTAVVAVNDLTAVGVINSLIHCGCRVPEDISVTGFDKTSLAQYCTPSLTTVDVHPELLGRTAAEALDELLVRGKHGREYHIRADLVMGTSTGPACRSDEACSRSGALKSPATG